MFSTNTYVIIVTFNGMSWLGACLHSCKNYPVIVIDNASTDDTVSFIQSNYPEVKLIKQSENLGFGQANNIGIRYALDHGAEHVFLLNQDAYLVDDVLDKLVEFQKEAPQYGILSPVHITGNRKQIDKRFFNYMLEEKTRQFYSDFVLSNTLAPVYEVPFVNAAAWLVSKKCLETVGGFDPLFFHYGEDDNYCQRVKYHKFKIGVLPNVLVIHDREDREESIPALFSPEYYKNVQRSYKAKYANININNKLDSKVNKFKKAISKLQFQMKFERAAAYKKELAFLLDIRPLIEKSRETNKRTGAHYF